MTWSTEAKTRATFLTAAVIVVMLGVLAYQNTANVADSTEQRYQAYDILQAQDAAWIAWNEAVVAQLGYVRSGDEAYLEQYMLARKATVENMTQLLRLQFENASQLDQSVRLVPLVAASLTLADSAILLKRVGLDSLAAGIGFTAISSSLLDASHRAFDALQANARRNATTQTAEYDLGSQYAIILTVVRTLLMLGILAFSYYFIQRDLVGRRRFEHLLGEERTLLRTVIDVLPINIYVKDADLRFVLMNRSQAKLVGAASPESAIGKRDADFFPTEWVAQYVSDERAIFETGEPLIGREEPSISPDGEQLVMLTTKVPVRDTSGCVTQIVGVSQDITTRKAAEREIEGLNESLRQHATQLERANQEMEAFSYSISHDLRRAARHRRLFTHHPARLQR
ncbi:MAG: PAS domain-containing protein [Anaerolineae bacterium]